MYMCYMYFFIICRSTIISLLWPSIMADEHNVNTKRHIYTQHYKVRLLETVELFKSIIENKCTNASTLKQKEDAWEKVSHMFNSETCNGPIRTTKSLVACYKNIKSDAKKHLAAEKVIVIFFCKWPYIAVNILL